MKSTRKKIEREPNPYEGITYYPHLNAFTLDYVFDPDRQQFNSVEAAIEHRDARKVASKVTTTHDKETRRIVLPKGSKIEVRKNADGTRSVAGDAIMYGTQSQDLGGFVEIIAAGAFSDSLKTTYTDVALLYGHQDNAICARVANGSLSITDTKRALSFKASIAPTSWGKDLVTLLETELVTGMSFAFAVLDDEWAYVDEQLIRTVKTAVLYELSAVPNPAYLSSTVNLRNLPADLRKHLKRTDLGYVQGLDMLGILDSPSGSDTDTSDGDNDVDTEDDECRCICANCHAGECERCNTAECRDDNCLACPMQTRAAHLHLLQLRAR